MKGIFKKLLIVIAPLPFMSSVSLAADDAAGRSNEISLEAAIIRVPLDEQGRELREAAEMRLDKGTPVDLNGKLNPEELWARSVDDAATSDADDSSTRWFGWRPYYYWPYGGYSYYYYPPYYSPYYYPYRPYRW
jgi:hypothetical protein